MFAMSRVLAVQAQCRERWFVLNQPSVDHAEKIPKEPIVLDAARCSNGGFQLDEASEAAASPWLLCFQQSPFLLVTSYEAKGTSYGQTDDQGH